MDGISYAAAVADMVFFLLSDITYCHGYVYAHT